MRKRPFRKAAKSLRTFRSIMQETLLSMHAFIITISVWSVRDDLLLHRHSPYSEISNFTKGLSMNPSTVNSLEVHDISRSFSHPRRHCGGDSNDKKCGHVSTTYTEKAKNIANAIPWCEACPESFLHENSTEHSSQRFAGNTNGIRWNSQNLQPRSNSDKGISNKILPK